MISARKESFFTAIRAAKYTFMHREYNDFLHSPRPVHNLAVLTKGSCEITVNDTVIDFNCGDVLFIPKGTVYASEWTGNPQISFTSLHFDFTAAANPFLSCVPSLQVLKTDEERFVKEKLSEILELRERGTDCDFQVIAAAYSIFSIVFPKLKTSMIKHGYGLIQPAISLMENRFREDIKIKQLADLCCISESRFFAWFKKLTGTTPVEYKNRIAIGFAKAELISEPDKSVERVAEECGFDSAIYFRRVFRKITGKTPSEYRKNESVL